MATKLALHIGACHCGKVEFQIKAEINSAIKCNCSICQKKGALHYRIPKSRFKLIKGERSLAKYQFNTKKATHFFCKHCGIHPFSYPRIDPRSISVNILCLDDYDLLESKIFTNTFDGKHWEESAKASRSESKKSRRRGVKNDKKKILVIDRDRSVCRSFKTKFIPAGYDVDSALRGKAALARARKKKYDLIFMDISLPEMDSAEACYEIKRIQGDAKIIYIGSILGKELTEKEIDFIEAGGIIYTPYLPFFSDEILKFTNKLFDK